MLLVTKPENIKELLKRIYAFLLSFSGNMKTESIDETIAATELLSLILSINFEVKNDTLNNFLWEIKENESIPFGKRLLDLLIRLAFLPQFTVNEIQEDFENYNNKQKNTKKDSLIWF